MLRGKRVMRSGHRSTWERKAFALWRGQATPEGSISTESNLLHEVPFTKSTSRRTSLIDPTELVAAAQAACFSSTLAAELARAGFQAQTIQTTAAITSEECSQKRTISGIFLDVVAAIPGAQPGDFIVAAFAAKQICPICRLLNVDVTMNARLER
jgi:osmotically inducible protein OsmC